MSGTSGTSTLPSFVAEMDRLSDELELFGFPRMLPPEFMPDIYPNGKMEMESVKVLDLLHTLMDSLWTMVQAKHRERELFGQEGDAAVKLGCQLKALETDFHKLQAKVKQKNHYLCVLTKETSVLKSSQKDLSTRVAAQEETIRILKSQMKHASRSTTAKLAARDLEIDQLRDRVRQGGCHGSGATRTSALGILKASRGQEVRLKEAIVHYQRTNEVLVEENLALQQLRGTETGDGTQEMEM